jgi:exodeoxyribonuclease VII large subunit
MTRQHELFPDDDPQPRRFARKRDFFPRKTDRPVSPAPPIETPVTPEPTCAETPTTPPLAGSSPTAPAETPTVYTVTQLARLIRLAVCEHLPRRIVVRGQLSGWKPSRSGHVYCCLKDEDAAVEMIAWRSTIGRLKFEPADGMEVIATGRMDFYERSGQLRLIIDKIEPAGVGALELAFRQLAEKLRAEGLFDEARKKPLPRFPFTIAIVTSPTGAAIQDIGRTLALRWPIARKLLYPVAVQGEDAPGEIARALYELNRRREELAIDVVIVGRGGGSIEDLWAFNEEAVARAIAASAIPVISAVGHEIDVTISDLVADARAATPTAAAQLACPVLAEVRDYLAGHDLRLRRGWTRHYTAANQRLEQLASRPCFRRPEEIVRFREQRLDEFTAALQRAWMQRRHLLTRKLENCARILRQIEPHRALQQAQQRLLQCHHRLARAQRESRWRRHQRLDRLAMRLTTTQVQLRIAQEQQTLLDYRRRLRRGTRDTLHRRNEHLQGLLARLRSLDPRAVLRRGYTITRTEQGELVTPDLPVQKGQLLWTELADNLRLQSQVTQPPQPGKKEP